MSYDEEHAASKVANTLYEDDVVPDYVSKRKRLAPPDKHIMNTNERRELTRLQQKSGKTEEELRKDIGVRRKLAAASKKRNSSGGTRGSKYARTVRALKHEFAAKLGTHINDPRLKGLAETEYSRTHDVYGHRRRFW